MIASHVNAILVKVAALGLDPHRHLGRPLPFMRAPLHSLRDRFGCNVCGEGGEYETLTLDCPAFTNGRIALESWEVRHHSPDAVAAVGVLRPIAFRVEPKPGGGAEAAGEGRGVSSQEASAGGQLSSSGSGGGGGGSMEAVIVEVPQDWQPAPGLGAPRPAPPPPAGPLPPVRARLSGAHAHLSCAPAPRAATSALEAPAADEAAGPDATAAALHAALHAISAELPGLGLTWDDSLFVHLYLSDMAHFGPANAAYCQHLPALSPPSRACVQLALPGGAPLAVDVLFARCEGAGSGGGGGGSGSGGGVPRGARAPAAPFPRRVLHVQSISDWAPSCIGPYSQVRGPGLAEAACSHAFPHNRGGCSRPDRLRAHP
jgi:diphthine-ammonia ligase